MNLKLSEDLKTIFKKFFITLIIYGTFINALLIYNYYVMIVNKGVNVENTIRHTIIEFNDIDPEHLCNVVNCSKIVIFNYSAKHHQLFEKSNGQFKFIKDVQNMHDESAKHICIGNICLSEDFEIHYKIEEYNMYVTLEQSMVVQAIIQSWYFINLSFILFYIVFFVHQEIQMRKRNFQQVMGATSILREKNMQLLTENIHHELNTPIAIINGLVRNIEIELNSIGMNYSFDQIYSAVDQIKTVLERMSNFKQIKYSNGNKSLYDIVSYGANAMTNYKKFDYVININPDLKNYGVNNKNLNNADVLNVITNHFKNALEASAKRIEISLKFNEAKQLLYIYLIDTGTGVRGFDGLILPKEKYDDIFAPHWSTKNDKGEFVYGKVNDSKNFFYKKYIKLLTDLKIWLSPEHYGKTRGMGLYFNRQFLADAGGDMKLIETSEKGTVFLLIIPAYDKKMRCDLPPKTQQ